MEALLFADHGQASEDGRMSQSYTLNANGRERPQVLANIHAFVDVEKAGPGAVETCRTRSRRNGSACFQIKVL